ncbi:outer membrane protein assembly factor BamE [Veillonella sp.]|jgi:hypothetical protein|uniref:outer membrane protein assembly factor BamE domain-containing protein n=1 Tax=Veillonella sp. TaxID=1926307 RepID=UPI001CB63271|nr:outer membrane protein assembly factor BamE [Veillonella sp.]MBF1760608.1 hypothetical protein [Veillonella sp.]
MKRSPKLMIGMALGISCLFSSLTIEAQQMSVDSVVRASQKVSGEWYDARGNKVLTISNGYINGCLIVGGADFVGGYPGAGVFIIQEAQGRKAIHLEWLGNGEHRTLIMNKKDQLTNRLQKEHYESVRGVHLGMTRQQVIDLLGMPSSSDVRGRETLRYEDLGLSIDIDHNMVVVITITGKGSHFDKSGLGVDASMIEYYNFYQFNRMPSELSKDIFQGPFSIGHGEYIFFSGKEISLTVYSN